MTRELLAFVGRGDGHRDRELAEHLCRACVAGAGVDGAALSVRTATVHRETLSATDATAAVVEDLQYTLGQGICLNATASGRPVLVPDLYDHTMTTRWPVYAAAVAEQTPARAVFALPLQLGTINLGVLDLYRVAPGSLRGPELRDLTTATAEAGMLLLDLQLRADVDRWWHGRPASAGPGQVRDVWSSRAEVHQATGMVLVQLGVEAQDAFVRLRAYAFAHQRRLDDVARDVVARRLVFSEDMD